VGARKNAALKIANRKSRYMASPQDGRTGVFADLMQRRRQLCLREDCTCSL
jgi:hypothetical protein